MQEVGLLQVARFVQLPQVGAAPGEKMHVPVLDARQEQVVRGAAGALDVGQQEVKASAHVGLLCVKALPRGLLRLAARSGNAAPR